MSTFFKARKFTISSIYVRAQWKKSLKPKLTISGDWMKEAGFEIGQKVEVQTTKNQLIITVIRHENSN